jgi:hypothetical protein
MMPSDAERAIALVVGMGARARAAAAAGKPGSVTVEWRGVPYTLDLVAYRTALGQHEDTGEPPRAAGLAARREPNRPRDGSGSAAARLAVE